MHQRNKKRKCVNAPHSTAGANGVANWIGTSLILRLGGEKGVREEKRG